MSAVDAVESVPQAKTRLREGPHYDVVIVDVDMVDGPWALVDRLVAADPPIGSVLVTTANRSWAMHERAEQAGCRALLDKPFDPGHLYRAFQMI